MGVHYTCSMSNIGLGPPSRQIAYNSSHKLQAWPGDLSYHKSTLTKALLQSLGSIPGSTSCNNGRTWLQQAGYDSSGLTSALATDVTQFKVAVNWWGSVRVPIATYNLWQESTHSDVIGLYWRMFKIQFTWLNFSCVYICGSSISLIKTQLGQE